MLNPASVFACTVLDVEPSELEAVVPPFDLHNHETKLVAFLFNPPELLRVKPSLSKLANIVLDVPSASDAFDFIFLDAWLNYDQVKRELKDWYPKLKHGGLFIGHDYKSDAVATAVSQFREQYSIKSHMAVYDSTFVWKKGGSEW